MAYLGDPRENAIDLENHTIWEQDNRKEDRYIWNGAVLDLCNMTPEEYMKNPTIEAIKENSQEASTAVVDAINEASDKIVNKISASTDSINENMDESTEEIVETINSAATFIAETLHSSTTLEILFYYTSINSQIDADTLTQSDFASDIVVIGSDTYINYLLGDPTPENWEKFINSAITEEELRSISSNNYYIAIPKAYKGKLTILENGSADVTSKFVEIPSDIFNEYVMYQSVDDDYFNEDYPTYTNVKQPHKITIAK